jgi:hypothetical protein
MKTKLLSIVIVTFFFGFSTLAQVLYSEDFEALNVGEGIAQQVPTWWTTWDDSPGTATDPLVSSAYANGGSNSLIIGAGNDVVMTVGSLTENRYKMDFYIYIPTDRAAFYSPMHDFDPDGSVYNNGMEVFFINGNAYMNIGGEQDVAEFDFDHDTWIHIVQYFDLDNGTFDFIVNDQIIYSGNWSGGNSPNVTILQGFDMYGWDNDGTPEFYLDDIVFEQVESANPPTNLSLEVQNVNDVLVSWDAPAEGTPESYIVTRNGEYLTTVEGSTTYLDESLYPSTYEYQVKAYYGEDLGYSTSTEVESIEVVGGNPRQLVLLEIFTGTECTGAQTVATAVTLLGSLNLDVAIINYQSGTYEVPAYYARSEFYTPLFDEDESEDLLCPTSIVNGMDGVEGLIGTLIQQRNYYRDMIEEYLALPSVYTITEEVSYGGSNTFYIDVDVEETMAYYGEDEMRLFVALTESNISESWQGQTELDYVLRDMADADGTLLDFSTESTQSESYQIMLTNEFDMQNCNILVFVQNMANGYIMEVSNTPLADFVSSESLSQMQISVYPNPAKNNVRIACGSVIQNVHVYNVTGEQIMFVQPNSNLAEISTEALAGGVYIIQIETDLGVEIKRLIIE